MLISLLLAAAPTLPAAPPTPEARFAACAALARTDAVKALAEAEAWRSLGGGLPARECLGLAYVGAERWAPAALAFEQAAREAEIGRDGRAAMLWVQSGNASLAGDDAGKARIAFDRALALPALAGALRGEVHMDRARALVELGDAKGARIDLDTALKLVPDDPMGWLLSAALARRQGDLARAAADIAEAARRAPGDTEIEAERTRIDGMHDAAAPAIKAKP